MEWGELWRVATDDSVDQEGISSILAKPGSGELLDEQYVDSDEHDERNVR